MSANRQGAMPAIACATDRRYAQLLGVMLASLSANGEIGDAPVFVLGYRLRAQDKKRIRDSFGRNRDQLTILDVDTSISNLHDLPNAVVSNGPVPYFKLTLPALLPLSQGILLYLDCDLIVRGSLQPLRQLDLTDSVLAAVEDSESAHPSRDGRFSFASELPYFNSGVLLINLARWQTEDISGLALEFLSRHPVGLKYPDQDALNAVLAGRWLKLDSRWNVTSRQADASSALSSAAILHFTGVKPWSARCQHPGRNLFLYYRAQTPWRSARLESRFEDRMRKSIMRRIGRLRTYLQTRRAS
jgi:lipopolysaccharide biosynthesis glycosyltransferase